MHLNKNWFEHWLPIAGWRYACTGGGRASWQSGRRVSPCGGGRPGTKSFYSELQTFLTFVSWTRLSIWTSSQTVNIRPTQTEMNLNHARNSPVHFKWPKTPFHPYGHNLETLFMWRPIKLQTKKKHDCYLGPSLPGDIVIRIRLWADQFLSVHVLYRNWPPPAHINPSTHKSFRSVIRLIWRQIDWES